MKAVELTTDQAVVGRPDAARADTPIALYGLAAPAATGETSGAGEKAEVDGIVTGVSSSAPMVEPRGTA